jgi:PIN domain nuclease of toxin-antitoxin system
VIVLDTHTWLWWTNEPGRLSRRATQAIGRAESLGVCTISAFELGERAARGRLEFRLPFRSWVHAALASDRVEALPLTADIAIDAAQLLFTGDPFDRIIYATARAEDAQLVTRDERLHAFDPKRAVW